MSTVVKYSLFAWILYLIFWVTLVSSYIDFVPALVRVLSIVLIEMAIFYINLLYLIPKYLDIQLKQKYFLLTFSLIAFTTFIGGIIDLSIEEYAPYNIGHAHERPLYSFFLMRFFLSMMPWVVSSLVSRSIQVRKQREESLELKNKMLEAESKALKAQINPHFLFNSLNNIYALAQVKSEKTGDAVLQLSDILRYVTYDSNQDFVSLKEEIKTIESYILLQALKDENQSNIKIEIDTQNGHYQIAPLLLIPFVENCFKHANHDDKEKGWIHIKLKAANGRINLICVNSFDHSEKSKDKTGGVGMENVKKRLALLYPDKHRLTISYNHNEYKAELEIILNA